MRDMTYNPIEGKFKHHALTTDHLPHHPFWYPLSPAALNAWRPHEIINIVENHIYAILDLGCTRSIGSRKAVLAFEEDAWKHGITCEWKRCWTKMSSANSKTEWLEWFRQKSQPQPQCCRRSQGQRNYTPNRE